MRVALKITELGEKITAILLREKDERTAMKLALQELGSSILVSRVYLFENISMPNGDVITTQKYEWCAEGISPQISNTDMQHFSFKEILPDVYGLLSLGQNINAIVSDLTGDFRAALESQDIMSVLLVPIIIDGVFRGFIGFDDCINKEIWSDSEVDLLRLSANSIGLYLKIKREEIENSRKLMQIEFFVETMNLGVWNWDIQTGEVVFSDSLAAMLGYTMVEWGAGLEAWSSRVHPDDWNTITPAIKNHIEGLTDYYESEHRLMCKDGTYKWVLDRGKVVERDEKGTALRMIGSHTDIQFVKDYQAKIEMHQKYFQVFFDNNPVPLLLVDMETATIVNVSNSACSQYGYTKEEFLVLSYFDLIPDDEKPGIVEQYEKDGILSQECRCNTHKMRDGGTFFVDLYMKTILYNDRAVLLILSQDITEKKVATENLVESEARYKALVASLSEGIVFRYANGQIATCNKSAEKILGIPENQLVGKKVIGPIWKTLTEDEVEITEANHPATIALRTGKPVKNVVLKICKTESEISWIRLNAIPLFKENDEKPYAVVTSFSDITEIKKFQNKIAESENNFRQFYNGVNDLGFIIDVQGNIIDVNRTTLEVLGYTKDELVGQSILFVHPESRRTEAESIFGDMLTGRTKECNLPLVTKTRKTIPVETHVVKGKWSNQDVFFGTSRDLSKIIANQEIFIKAFHRNPEPMALLTKTWRFADVNESFQRALGYTKEELKDKGLADIPIFTGESQRFIVENEFNNAGFIKDLEIVLKTKTGDIKQVILRLDTIKPGNIELVMFVFTDITELKKVYGQLKDAHAQLESFFRAFDDMVFMYDTETHHFTYVNNGSEKIFGRRIPINEDVTFLGKYLSLEDYQHLNNNIASIIKGNILKGELKLNFPDGTNKWLLYKLWSRSGNDKKILEGICSDITATKQIVESTQRALAKEKELNELKSIFISTASHEFRTPLATILSSVDIMESYDSKLTATKRSQHYVKIKKSVKQMTSMLNEILTLSKKELSQVEVKTEKVNLIRLFNQIKGEIEASNQTNNVQIELINKAGEETFALNAKLMKSMLINLLLNAVKYSHPGSPVIVTVFTSKHDLVIEVSDRGIGIEQNDLKNIFKPFYRGKNVGDRAGTGLGMAIIKEGIEALKGTIHIASHVGAGTTVTLKIPVRNNPLSSYD